MSKPLTDTGHLLEAITQFLRRYVRMTDDQAYTVAAWSLQTWVCNKFTVTPYLAVMSPVKRSGKTTLLNCLANVTCEGDVLFDPTSAALYRMIEMSGEKNGGPTLLWDELDFTRPSRPIIAILNSGYKKGGFVPRVVTKNKVQFVEKFYTYCPKAFGSIGQVLPPTQLDRTIQVHLDRAMKNETVTEYDEEEVSKFVADLRWALIPWSDSWERPAVKPLRPDSLNARQKELWLPLLEIAATAGGQWTRHLMGAAERLSAESDCVESDETINLLEDLRAAIGTSERVFSRTLLYDLQGLDEPAYSGEATNSMRMLALFLSSNFRIHPKEIRIGQRTGRGYYTADFKEAFRRYL
jgi:putative DNA primase/helicase